MKLESLESGGYAYERLRVILPADRIPLLEGFYNLFRVYENTMSPEEASRKALIGLAGAYKPEIAPPFEKFNLTNYNDPRAIAFYIYREGGFEAYSISFEDFQKLRESPEGHWHTLSYNYHHTRYITSGY